MSRGREAWIDALVVLVAMATILSIFEDTFADRTYLVAGLVPVVVLLALALASRRLHEGGWWYTLAALVLFSPLGVLAALRQPGPYVVPTLETMSRLLADTVRAPTTLVSTVPPVDGSGIVMLVPYVVAFLATLPAAWLAVGTTRPLAPVVPLVAALAATIPLGVLVPTLLVARGVFLAVLLVGWGAVRARRRETAAGVARGSVAASVSAVVVVALVSVLVSTLVPDDDKSDRVLLQGEANDPLVTGALVPALPTGRRGFRPLLKATGVPDGQRLRFTVLDRYDGEAWVPAEESPGTDGYGTFKRIGTEVAPLHPGRTVVVKVRMRPGYVSDWLPMLGELTRVDLDWNPGRTSVGEIRYNQATSSAFVVGGVDSRDEYTFESVLDDERFSRRDPTRGPSGGQEQPAGESLDELLRPFDRDDLLPIERVLLLARYLRVSGTVRHDFSADQSAGDLGRMLGSRRMEGSPYEYSALMALGASRLGVPARVVTGAAVGRRGLVHDIDVQAWVELQFADGSWRTLEPERYVGEHVSEEDAAPELLDAEQFVRDQLVEASKGDDREIRPPEGSTNPDGSVAQARPAWQVILLVLAACVGLGMLALLLVPVAKHLRRRRRRRASTWTGVWVNGWQEVLDAARDRGTPVADGWSRVAQATTLGAGVDLARRADAAVFAPGRPDDDADDFWEQCQALRRWLLTATPTRRARWWSYVNPASLVAGWARRRGSDPSARQVGHEDRRARGQQPTRA